ncbi:hypothetical protein ACSQ6I_08360 [Anabaena sp. WFMT]|uniref:hypothetical protein n=1 Tax=Anabaena sp. WFMT TaxID=3449730 RepID=UPI003F249CAE
MQDVSYQYVISRFLQNSTYIGFIVPTYLAVRIVEKLPTVVEQLPPCSIRRDCRWWQQEGNFSGVHVPPLKDSNQQQVAFSDSMSTVRSLIQACPAKWINSWQAYQFHQEKPLQLAKAKQIGVTIPAAITTIISNDPDEIRELFKLTKK